MNQQVLKALKSKHFVISILIAFFIVVGIYTYFTSIKDLVVFPGTASYKYESYTDESNGGNSEIIAFSVSDSMISLQYLLKDKFLSPYVGLGISPENEQYINIKKFNQVNLSIRGLNVNRIGFALYTPPLNFVKVGKDDETINHSYLTISNQKVTHEIPFKQFKHPEWWEDLHQISASEEIEIDKERILHINVSSAFSPDIGGRKTIELYSIAFTRNNKMLLLWLIISYISFVLLYLGFVFISVAKKKPKDKITVSYQSLEIMPSSLDEESCVEYINKNYHNSDLSLEIISEAVSVSSRRVTNIIQDRFNCNFKTYLNRIRINESKRLLIQSDLNMGEIAFKVGFNSQSHFNRVFKSEQQVSPSEYREANHS